MASVAVSTGSGIAPSGMSVDCSGRALVGCPSVTTGALNRGIGAGMRGVWAAAPVAISSDSMAMSRNTFNRPSSVVILGGIASLGLGKSCVITAPPEQGFHNARQPRTPQLFEDPPLRRHRLPQGSRADRGGTRGDHPDRHARAGPRQARAVAAGDHRGRGAGQDRREARRNRQSATIRRWTRRRSRSSAASSCPRR